MIMTTVIHRGPKISDTDVSLDDSLNDYVHVYKIKMYTFTTHQQAPRIFQAPFTGKIKLN